MRGERGWVQGAVARVFGTWRTLHGRFPPRARVYWPTSHYPRSMGLVARTGLNVASQHRAVYLLALHWPRFSFVVLDRGSATTILTQIRNPQACTASGATSRHAHGGYSGTSYGHAGVA
jgi:hypothetical protein